MHSIIIAIDGEKVETSTDLQEVIFAKPIDSTVIVTIIRDGEKLDKSVVLGKLKQ